MSDHRIGPDLESGNVTRSSADEVYTLGELIEYANEQVESGTPAGDSFSRWCERVYFPAKESLIDFLVWAGLLLEDADEEGGDA